MRWKIGLRSRANKQTVAIGLEKERQAENYLRQKGFHIKERNFSCKTGEIDLIMLDGDTLVFIEVRYRRSHEHGSALESVDIRKQQKLLRTAQFYLQAHYQHEPPCRFDVIGIGDGSAKGESHIEWVPDAFGA